MAFARQLCGQQKTESGNYAVEEAILPAMIWKMKRARKRSQDFYAWVTRMHRGVGHGRRDTADDWQRAHALSARFAGRVATST